MPPAIIYHLNIEIKGNYTISSMSYTLRLMKMSLKLLPLVQRLLSWWDKSNVCCATTTNVFMILIIALPHFLQTWDMQKKKYNGDMIQR